MSKALVLYDTAYGNTAKIAEAIAGALSEFYETKVELVSRASIDDVRCADILVVGSPTQGGQATKNTQNFISRLSPASLQGVKVTAFDTRFAATDHGLGLRLLMKTIGFAAGRIASALKSKGGELAVEPEGFIVEDKEGPLKRGEIERAASWIRQLAQISERQQLHK